MRRGALLALAVLLAGCAAPTATGSPTPSATTPADEVGVEYVVETGTIPDDVASVTVTLRVVFVGNPADVGPCWRETFSGPYRPTPTPIAPPTGDCHRSATVTLDLAALDGERSLGRFTAPGRFAAGHALVATNASATYRNGSAVGGIRGATDKRLNVVEGPPAGPYRVTLSLKAYADRPYDYWFVAATA